MNKSQNVGMITIVWLIWRKVGEEVEASALGSLSLNPRSPRCRQPAAARWLDRHSGLNRELLEAFWIILAKLSHSMKLVETTTTFRGCSQMTSSFLEGIVTPDF